MATKLDQKRDAKTNKNIVNDLVIKPPLANFRNITPKKEETKPDPSSINDENIFQSGYLEIGQEPYQLDVQDTNLGTTARDMADNIYGGSGEGLYEQTEAYQQGTLNTDYLNAVEDWLSTNTAGQDWLDFRINGDADKWYKFVNDLNQYYTPENSKGYDVSDRAQFDELFNLGEQDYIDMLYDGSSADIARILGNDPGAWAKTIWDLQNSDNPIGIGNNESGFEFDYDGNYDPEAAYRALNEELLARYAQENDPYNLASAIPFMTNHQDFETRMVTPEEREAAGYIKRQPMTPQEWVDGGDYQGSIWDATWDYAPDQMDLSAFNPTTDSRNRSTGPGSIYKPGVFDSIMAEAANRYGNRYGYRSNKQDTEAQL